MEEKEEKEEKENIFNRLNEKKEIGNVMPINIFFVSKHIKNNAYYWKA